MSRVVHFALCADPLTAGPAFDEMAGALLAFAGVKIEPLFVHTYSALSLALEQGACGAAWSPPLIAQELVAHAIGKPLVAVGRKGRTSYYSVLVARRGVEGQGIDSIAGAKVGWVSKLSAAGYVVPSLYLRSLGLEPNEIFAEQYFLGTHERVAAALADGEIDVGATHASIAEGGRMLDLPPGISAGARVVAAAGPIPGDVIFAAAELPASVRSALLGGFLAMQVSPEGALARFMSVDRFEVPNLGHFETIRRWRRRAVESERPPAHASPDDARDAR